MSVAGEGTVNTFRGERAASELGVTLIHEHVFVGHPELDLNFPHPEWSEDSAVAKAVAGLDRLWDLGVRTVVDLTVLGLGRDVRRVARVAERSKVNLIASTGYYTADVLPAALRQDPSVLVDYFVKDITEGIAGTGIRAAMLKVVTDRPGLTPDVRSVMTAAAETQKMTGVPITTHTHAPSRNGLDQLAFFVDAGVSPERLIIGHSGDTTDLSYLRELADAGCTLGLDRFGMEHVLPDQERISTLLELLELGYADRMVLSHDAAWFSRVTPPSWRAQHAPNWHHERLHRDLLPLLREQGVGDDLLEQLFVSNPARLLTPER